jgi:Predicted membrane protein (DUF2207)
MLTAVVLAGAVVATLALVGAFWRARASRRVELAMWPPVLGSESPAVASLLVHDFTLTRDAVAATLLDLAARGHVRVEEIGAGSLVCRLHGREPRGLNPYEQQVYDAIRDACSDGSVPVEVLTREIHHQPRRWRAAFERAVLDDARERDLIEARWTASRRIRARRSPPGRRTSSATRNPCCGLRRRCSSSGEFPCS